mgnify:CR=1 FL=1
MQGQERVVKHQQELLFFSECFLNVLVEVEIIGALGENFIKLFAQQGFLACLLIGRAFFEIEELTIKVPILTQEIFQYFRMCCQPGAEQPVRSLIVQPAQGMSDLCDLAVFFTAIVAAMIAVFPAPLESAHG